MALLRSFTVTFDDGSKLSTNMAKNITDEEIRKYYIGQTFVDEDYNGKETRRKGVSVEIHEDFDTNKTFG